MQAQTTGDLERWGAALRVTHPEMFRSDEDEVPVKARARWAPAFLRVYGLRPWEVGRLTVGEYNALADDLQEHGL